MQEQSALDFVEIIPPELTTIIFSFLDAKALASSCLTSHKWHSIASVEELWKPHKDNIVVLVGSSKPVYVWQPDKQTITELMVVEDFKRNNMRAVSFGGKVYIAGGYSLEYDPWTVATLEVLIPRTKELKKLAPMTQIREGFGLLRDGRFLYAFAGTDGHNYLDSMERYDIDNDKWEALSTKLPFKTAYFASAVLNGELYVHASPVGEKSPDVVNPYSSIDNSYMLKYNIAQAKWSYIRPPPGGISLLLVYKGKLHCIPNHVYDEETITWQECDLKMTKNISYFLWRGEVYSLQSNWQLSKFDRYGASYVPVPLSSVPQSTKPSLIVPVLN